MVIKKTFPLFVSVDEGSFLGDSWVTEERGGIFAHYRLSTDVLPHNQSVGGAGKGQPLKLKREFMTSDPNLWTACVIVCLILSA